MDVSMATTLLVARVFVVFSVVSVVLGVVITVYYSMALGIYHRAYGFENDAELAFKVILLILGVVEFVIGIWASKITPCCNHSIPEQQRRQMVNSASTAGSALNQRNLGHGVPVQPGGGIKTVQELKHQEGQLPEVIVAITSSYDTSTYV